MPVGGALFLQRRRLRGGEVLQPLGGFLRAPGSDVDRQIGPAADLIDEVHELVRAKGVRLDHAAPVRVHLRLTIAPDAFPPVVVVGEAATGPPHVRNPQHLESGDDVIANAARVGDGRVGTDPYALVDALAEVFRELAEEVAVDLRTGLRRVHGQRDRCGAPILRRGGEDDGRAHDGERRQRAPRETQERSHDGTPGVARPAAMPQTCGCHRQNGSLTRESVCAFSSVVNLRKTGANLRGIRLAVAYRQRRRLTCRRPSVAVSLT